ncbi:MAG: hypothetical protein VX848_05360 [Verrucomicrobiota bacterium]|nr:hypothetical protein [Verrucomicrobiota bacterium]
MQPGCFIISSIVIAIFGWVFLSQKEIPSKKVSEINEHPQEAKQISLEVINSTTTESHSSSSKKEKHSSESSTVNISPNNAPDKPLTREQLTARAMSVEKQANKRLDELTLLLDLDENQKDFIFPILAKSAASFHPSLNAQGSELLNGIESRVRPGAPIDVVESEIYDILNEEQKLILEEEALDREAWWDDIVALLDDESKQRLNEASTPDLEDIPSKTPQQPLSQEDREKNAAKSKVDDFSSLLKKN